MNNEEDLKDRWRRKALTEHKAACCVLGYVIPSLPTEYRCWKQRLNLPILYVPVTAICLTHEVLWENLPTMMRHRV